MKIRKSFVTNSSSASYVVDPSDHRLRANPDVALPEKYVVKEVARDMLDVMLEEDDDWWNGERVHPWKERLEGNLQVDSGIRFPSCNYDTHIWFDEYEGQRKIIIHTCNNHPFDTIDYFKDIGYLEDGSGDFYDRRNNNQIFYDLAKDEYTIGDEQYVYGPPCSCADGSISRFYISAEKGMYEERINDNEKLMWGNIVCCGCGKLIKIRAVINPYEDEDSETEYHFEGYWDEKIKPKKKRRRKITSIDEDLMNALLEG